MGHDTRTPPQLEAPAMSDLRDLTADQLAAEARAQLCRMILPIIEQAGGDGKVRVETLHTRLMAWTTKGRLDEALEQLVSEHVIERLVANSDGKRTYLYRLIPGGEA